MRIPTPFKAIRACALAAGILLAGQAAAQPGPGPAAAAAGAPDAGNPIVWSSPELERLGTQLSGMWKTTAAVPVPSGDGATEDVQLVLSIGPVGIAEMPDAMYFEVARGDALHAPYRQAIFQLFEYRDKVRLRTYEFRTGAIDMRALIGAWTMPEAFPPLNKDDFIATLDIEGTISANGFSGQTPYPYPTGVGGAVEMTSRLELAGDRLVTEDRGLAADGSIAWGQEAGGRYTYSKVDPQSELTITRGTDNGLVVVEYREGVGQAPQNGDMFSVHYTGWFARNATVFNSSYTNGIPFSYQYPGTMIEGWLEGTRGMKPGTLRRMYIPYQIAYKETGQPPRMPGYSNLVFEIECVSVQPAPPPPAGVPAPDRPDGAADVPG